MGEEEVVVAEGVKKFSNHSGYMATFKCAGACSDARTFRVLTMDAKNYNSKLQRAPDDPEHGLKVNYAEQFSSANVQRDVNKAAAAFQGCEDVSTGKWGCGIFRGNLYLKFLTQLLAASQVGVQNLSFTTYCQPQEAAQCAELHAALKRSGVSPEDLSTFLLSLSKKFTMSAESEDDTVFFDFVMKWLATQFRGQKRKA